MDDVTGIRMNILMKNGFNGGKNRWSSKFKCEWITGRMKGWIKRVMNEWKDEE